MSHRTDDKDELRAILGNPVAVEALRKGTLPLPDGAMLAKLAWKREPMPEFQGAFKPGASPRLEFMVKDSKKYPSTGGWGFARFIDGKPADEATHKTCFPCHEANVKGHDFVFTTFESFMAHQKNQGVAVKAAAPFSFPWYFPAAFPAKDFAWAGVRG